LPAIRAIFWDLGGVLLSNAWDHNERHEAFEHFPVDQEDFRKRHEAVVEAFERGQLTLDEYLDRTIFYRARPYTREALREYMFGLSKPNPDALNFARGLADSSKYFMGTINNESRELNNYRIEHFGLREIFRVFVSSCYVGLRKPGAEIYQLALELTQFPPQECCFIDDRAANLVAPAQLGMHTIEMKGVEPLKEQLWKLGVG
jgi:putative hydrolase of the HAD superfamily